VKILGVFAHPDDEIIFGWPVMQGDGERIVLVVSDNSQNYPNAVQALSGLRDEGVKRIDCLNIPSGFYRLPFRKSEVTLMQVVDRIKSRVSKMIKDASPDYLYTHNPMGEYGHGDHKLLFEICASLSYPMLFSDICMINKCHFGFEEIPGHIQKAYYNHNFFSSITLDKDFYRRGIDRYRKYHSWSWNGTVPETAMLFKINE